MQRKLYTSFMLLLLAISMGAQTTGRYAKHSLLASGRWVKISVAEEGVYALTKSKLSSMGFSNPDKVKLYGYGVPVMPETQLEDMDDDMTEIPLYRRSDGSLLFYSCGTTKWTRKNNTSVEFTHFNNPYSNYICYFVTDATEGTPKELKINDETSATASTVTEFPEHSLIENDAASFLNSGRTFYDSYDFANGNSRKYTMDLPGQTNGNVILNIQFAAAGKSGSSLQINANNSAVGNITFSALAEYQYASQSSGTYRLRDVNTESLPITLTHSRTQGVSGRLDYIRASYMSKLHMGDGNYMVFGPQNPSAAKYVIDGASSDTHVWNVTKATETYELKGAYADGKYTVGSKALNASKTVNQKLLAVNVSANYPSPIVLGSIENQDLHAIDSIDYVIIVPASGGLTTQAQRLADLHSKKEGMRCIVVSADKLYNEFSAGTPDITAYRRFLKMLYDKAPTPDVRPKNVCLFGNSYWDNRLVTSGMKSKKQEDYLLVYESDNSISHTDSYVAEEYITLLADGKGISPLAEAPDCGVGRIPVSNATEAEIVVNKLATYINNEQTGSWKNTICVMADDGNANTHMNDAEAVIESTQQLYPDYRYRKIYWDSYLRQTSSTGYAYPDTYNDINKQMTDGALIMNYTGHGAAYCLSHEQVLKTADFAQWNSPRLPLWITAACDVCPFDMDTENIAVTAVLNAKGGAMGMISTARTVYSSYNRTFNRNYMRSVLGCKPDGKRFTIGEALAQAKADIVNKEKLTKLDSLNKTHFVLMGDPAITLATPTYKLHIDRFGGQDNGIPTISAGQVVEIEGHVTDEDDKSIDSFNGSISTVVFDNEQLVTCYDNDGSAAKAGQKPKEYMDRNRTLFIGNDSISQGRFKVKFPVPLDINYSNKNGMLNLYASNNSNTIEAQGLYTKFLVGGSIYENTDTISPLIAVVLNSDQFKSGDTVNDTPLLIARLHDASGINMTGSGIGHDITAIIDNRESTTYSLNPYYTTDTGDYTTGQLTFSIPTLESGHHTLVLRAFDTFNNMGETSIEFYVNDKMAPQIYDLKVNSPVRNVAYFTIMNDRPESDLDVDLHIYDLTGRCMWQAKERGRNNGAYTFRWNIASTTGTVPPGVYVVKASISCRGGETSTIAKKFIITKQQ